MKRVIIAAIVIVISTNAMAQVTNNVYERVKRFRCGEVVGSAFTIEVDGHQYVITARHNLPKQEQKVQFELYLSGWKRFTGKAIYPSNDAVDIVALDVGTKLTVDFELEPTSGGVGLGQQVYFVGYPWGLATRGGLSRETDEIPFLKSGILSAMDVRQKDAMVLYVDGHNNPGFSGGPIVFRNSKDGKFRVAGVIKAYRFEGSPVLKKDDLINQKAKAYEDLYVRSNTGILVGFNIKHIVDAIESTTKGQE